MSSSSSDTTPSSVDSLSGEDRSRLALEALMKRKRETSASRIPRRSREPNTPVPLTFQQRQLWLAEQTERQRAAYNMPLTIRVEGLLDVVGMQRALRTIMERHDVLRAAVRLTDEGPRQFVAPSVRLPTRVVDLRGVPASQREDRAEHIVRQDVRRPFDVADGPLVRLLLLRLDDDDLVVGLTLHHLVCDAWSMGVLTREFVSLYRAHTQEAEASLTPLPFQYTDYAEWQRETVTEARIEEQLAYWTDVHADAPPPLALPRDRSKSEGPSGTAAPPSAASPSAAPAAAAHGDAAHGDAPRGDVIETHVDASATQRLNELARSEEASLFVVAFAAFQVLLHRYTGQTDLVTGTTVANRSEEGVESLIGYFVETLALRFDGDPTASVRAWIRQARDVITEGVEHSQVPFERVVGALREAGEWERRDERTPFRVMFVMKNAPSDTLHLPDLTIRPFSTAFGGETFDLTVTVTETKSGLSIEVNYNAQYYDAPTVNGLAERYATLLASVAEAPDTRADRIGASPAQEDARRAAWNDTDAPYPDTSMHAQVEARVAQRPDACALVAGGQHLTYAALDREAGRIARLLRTEGVAPSDAVGVCLSPSLHQMIAVYGVLKAGAACVPLDPSFPEARLHGMIEDADVDLVLTETTHRNALPEASTRLYALDARRDEWTALAPLPPTATPPDALAYVIFTSGSTGRPKGVGVPHRTLVNLLTWQDRHADYAGAARTLQFASLSFDMAFHDTLLTWMQGGTLLLIDDAVQTDPAQWGRVLDTERVERVFLPFVALRQLATAVREGVPVPASLREINSSGESFQSLPAIRSLAASLPDTAIHNLYGPSETHVVTAYALPDAPRRWASLPSIGSAIANTQIYLLDDALQPVPQGAEGEVYVGGANLAWGYLNRPAKTAAVFLPNPFDETPGRRLYKTGDRARRRADGSIDFVGRVDDQVQIHGYRVEPGEIEVVLADHPSVDAAVVVARDASTTTLCAYVIASEDVAVSALRAHLGARLPQYMMPSDVVFCDAFPKLPNGKVDRSSLPDPHRSRPDLGVDFVAPSTDAEKRLAAVWRELLDLDRVGVDDPFLDLGGDSILAIQVASRARGEGLRVRTMDVLDAGTIAELAPRATPVDPSPAPGSDRDPAPDPAPTHPAADGADAYALTPMQQGILYHAIAGLAPEADATASGEEPSYVECVHTTYRWPLDAERLRDVWAQLVARHDALRTAFAWEDGSRPRQIVHDAVDVPLRVLDGREGPADERERRLSVRLDEAENRRFDLQRPPLFHLTVIARDDRAFDLIWSFHDAILDGWSAVSVLQEFEEAYAAALDGRTPEWQDRPPFRRYVRWLDGRDRTEARTHWADVLGSAEAPTPLPIGTGAVGGEDTATRGDWPATLDAEAKNETTNGPDPSTADPSTAESATAESVTAESATAGATGADAASPRARTPQYGCARRSVDSQILQTLTDGAARHGLTFSDLVHGAWAVLLSRYSAESSVLFGSVVSGRSVDVDDAASMVGVLVNTLPVRVDVREDAPVAAWLKTLHSEQLAARAFASTPLRVAQRASGIPNDQPLFHTILDVVNYPDAAADACEGRSWSKQKSDYPLFVVVQPGDSLTLEATYKTRIFRPAPVERLLAHFGTLLRSLSEALAPNASAEAIPTEAIPTEEIPAEEIPAEATPVDGTPVDGAPSGGSPSNGAPSNAVVRVRDLKMLTDAETHDLVVARNERVRVEPPYTDVLDGFDDAVAAQPEATAVVHGAHHVSYASLDRRTDGMARALARRGVGPDVVVGLLGRRGVPFLISVLAILKAGGAYVPLDPDNPANRWRQVVRQSRTPLVLAGPTFQAAAREAFASLDAPARPDVVGFDLGDAVHASAPEVDPLPRRATPDHLAYVIFTSGSTGTPKGAMVERRGMVNHLYAKIRDLDLRPTDRIAQTASQCFDISVWQFIAPLLVGGEVRIYDKSVSRQPDVLVEAFDDHDVTVAETVPSLMRMLMNAVESSAASGGGAVDFGALRWMMPTGEALPPDLCETWFSVFPDVPLINAYGPTECSDDVTHHVLTAPPAPGATRVHIGTAIANVRLYVLDDRFRPTPVGVPGELYVGGRCVGRGYRREARRTSPTFVPDPFAHAFDGERGVRLYRTGDRVRWTDAGALDFLGRIDHQVKVRGFRVEIGEVEAVAAQHDTVDQVAVAVHQRGAVGKSLAAFVVPTGDTLEVDRLQAFLRSKLPEYMVPASYVTLDRLPLNDSGKLDRNALPAPDAASLARDDDREAPQGDVETRLARVWQNVLNVEVVGRNDGFFQLGGDSILGIQVAAQAKQQGLSFRPHSLFEHSTIKELAPHVERRRTFQAEQDAVTGTAPLTPIQRWFFDLSPPSAHHWNQAVLLETDTEVDVDALAKTVRVLFNHHDALRLRFAPANGPRTQRVAPAVESRAATPFSHVDLTAVRSSGGAADREAERTRLRDQVHASLDLADGPTARAVYFECGPDRADHLLFTAHHLVIDAVSWRFLLQDLQTAYTQIAHGDPVHLPPKTTSYKTWAERLARRSVSEAHRRFWAAQTPAPVPLPPDGPAPEGDSAPRPPVATTETLSVALDADATRALLRAVPSDVDVRMDAVLLAALMDAFHAHGGASAVYVDLENHGRVPASDDVDVGRTVGWFTALHAVHLTRADDADALRRLQHVNDRLDAVPEGGVGDGLLRYADAPGPASEDASDDASDDKSDDASDDAVGGASSAPRPDVVFNYLGRLDQTLPPASDFRFASVDAGQQRAPESPRPHRLDVGGFVRNGRLRVTVSYSRNAYRAETMRAFADALETALHALVEALTNAPTGPGDGFDPDAFDAFGWDESDLNSILDAAERTGSA